MNLQLSTKFSFTLLLSLFLAVTGFAQEREIKGVITDLDGQPIQGVTVTIKGTANTVITNAQGKYVLRAAPDQTLVFTSIGFNTKEIKVGDHPNISTSLARANSQLDDVIVVGYGTQKKIHLTGAVATVDMKQIQDLPVGSLSAALRGQMPGVSVSGGYSRPGDNAKITIRNPIFFSKDGGSTEPLYVIDDIIRSPADFNVLDASEIENISILKDAAAAIYGIQGANGVVVVRTKRGKAGSPKINYTFSAGTADAPKLPKMMSGYDHALYLNHSLEAEKNFVADGTNGYKADQKWYTPDELEHFRNNSTDWLALAWKPATTIRHALNVSGGNERATYFAGASYTNQTANFDNINTDKWTFRASSDIKLTNGLKLGLSVSGDVSKNKRYFHKQGPESAENDVRSLLGTPMFNAFYVNGLPTLLTTNTNSNLENYHFFEIQRSDNTTVTRNNGLNVQANLNYEVPFVPGLKAGINFSKNLENNFGKQYGTRYTVYEFKMLGDHKHIYGGDVNRAITLSNGDRIRLSPGYSDSYQLNASVGYERKFGKHQINFLGVYEQNESHSDLTNAMREGVIPGGLDNMNYATGVNTTEEVQTEYGRLAYVGRLNYNYANKYLAEFTYRADANVNFAPEYRWGYFPSMSLGWVASEEGFFQRNIRFIDFLKIRASVGLLGSDNTKGYQYLENYALQTGKAPIFGGNSNRGNAILPNTAIANYGLRWDDNTKYNAGIDLQFLRSRLSVSADAFLDHRYNQLTTLSSAVSLLVGANLPPENFSETKSFGYEISASWKDKITSDISYNINTFLSWSDNKLIIVDQPVGNIGTYLDAIGKSSDRGVKGYHYVGMFRTQEEVDEYVAKNPGYKIFGKAPKPGMLYYQDVRGPKDASGQYTGPDGVITEEDQDFLTHKSSNHYGLGFNFGITWKSLSLNVVSGMSFGGTDVAESAATKKATSTVNRPAFWSDHWTPDNTGAAYPNPYYVETYDVTSAFWFRSSFTWRIANFNLSYGIPAKWAQKVGMSNARFFLIGTNPLNLYNPYSWKDNSGSYDQYPDIRTFSLGLNAGF
jgi:TonB-linked SusC/RagA family outer membrane protein